MNIKRITAILIAVIMVFSFTACKDNGDEYSYYSDVILVEKENSKTSSTNDGADAQTGSNSSSDGKGSGTTSTGKDSNKVVAPTQSTSSNDGTGIIVTGEGVKPTIKGFKANYTIKNGSTPVDKGLDLKGKTITMATGGGVTTSYSRMVKAFEAKYNCKVKITDLNFATYITQLAAAVAANNAFDICGMQGDHFPTEAIKGLIEPLENAITTADLYDANKKDLHSIDFNFSQYTSWGNHLYGVCGHGANASQPMVFYYNKKLFKESGLEDPYELYKDNKWTWSKIEQMGRIVTDPTKGVYFLDGDCVPAIVNSYAPEWISYTDNGVKENFSAKRNINAVTYAQKLANGNSAIMGPFAFTNDTTSFFAGKSYIFYQSFVYGQQYIRPAINDGLAAFGNDPKNMGVVPIPMSSENTEKAYEIGSLDFITCGKGRNPLYAVTWAKFKSGYDSSSANDKNAYSKEEWKLIESLADGKVHVNRTSGFVTSSGSVGSLISNIIIDGSKGGDVAQLVAANRQKAQSYIDTTLGEQK